MEWRMTETEWQGTETGCSHTLLRSTSTAHGITFEKWYREPQRPFPNDKTPKPIVCKHKPGLELKAAAAIFNLAICDLPEALAPAHQPTYCGASLSFLHPACRAHI